MTLPAKHLAPWHDPSDFIRVSDLRQWTYCQRVAYFSLVCPVPKRSSFKMQLGAAKEARLAQLLRRRSLDAFGMAGGQVERDVELVSGRLGLSGRLDLLIARGTEIVPVEVKLTTGNVALHHRIQLAGYAMLLEEQRAQPVHHGFVICLPDESLTRVEIDQALRMAVDEAVRRIREMIEHETCPRPVSNPACCIDCEYRNYCGDTV